MDQRLSVAAAWSRVIVFLFDKLLRFNLSVMYSVKYTNRFFQFHISLEIISHDLVEVLNRTWGKVDFSTMLSSLFSLDAADDV